MIESGTKKHLLSPAALNAHANANRVATFRATVLGLGLLGLGACGAHASGTVEPTKAEPAKAAVAAFEEPTPPKLRLPELARPTRYDVDLSLDPAKEDFTGTITIELNVLAQTDRIWLNAEEITVKEATLLVGEQKLTAKTWAAPHDFLALDFGRKLEPGPAKLRIDYSGKLRRGSGRGIYTAQENKDWYLYTQFEATDARRAFPCFDEPSYKVPWRLTLHAPAQNAIIANTLPESESKDAQGWKSVRFTESKPLPSYLVAFAVGPMDFVDAGKSRSGVPIRVVTPKGRAGEVAYATQVTGSILAALEDYFGTPYPYDKLDIVAVPVFNAGAMENPGLVTYRQAIVVVPVAEETEGRKQGFAEITAHELAHQWFGDYVTLAFWDDTWLNESFASWAGDKIIASWKPEWETRVDLVSGKSGVMSGDSLESARKIHQPIESSNDIANAFDGITYGKGQAVLHMIEQWLGEEVMQKGVRAYLAKHAWGNATYADFVAALTEAGGRDVEAVLASFVNQVGVPLVTFDLECPKGQSPKLKMSQKRYLPTGSKASADVTWSVPVCASYGSGKTKGKDCTVLSAKTGELQLSQAKTCPDWVFPNSEGNGYYRMQPSADLTAKLVKHAAKLSLGERLNMVGDVKALVGADLLPVGDALVLVDQYAKDKARQLVEESVRIASSIDRLVPPELRPNYERFIRKVYGARAAQLGLLGKAGDTPEIKELRRSLVGLVGEEGRDPALVKEATALTWKWFDDHKVIDADMVGTVLGIAARYGDRALWDRFYAEAKKATDREERGRYLGALGSFAQPELVKASLALVLTSEFDLRDALGLLQVGGGSADPQVAAIFWSFIKDNFDALVAKMPSMYAPYLTFSALPLCSEAGLAEMEAFFKDRAPKMEGGPRIYAQALEQMSLCITSRKTKSPGVIEFLKKQ